MITAAKFVDFCIEVQVRNAVQSARVRGVTGKYSDAIKLVVDQCGMKLTVKPRDLATIDHSKATPGSMLLTNDTAQALMIWRSNAATVTVLTSDGDFRTRAWIMGDDIPRVIPIEEIYKHLVEK